MNDKILTQPQKDIIDAYNNGITRIYFSGAKNTSKNFLADWFVIHLLEKDELANAVGFRESKTNAVAALTTSFLTHIQLFEAHGYDPKYKWQTNLGNIMRAKYQGIKDKYKNQMLYLFSMENKNSVSNVSFANKGYAAFVYFDEVCSADKVGKSPEKLKSEWELLTNMIEDSIGRSIKKCEQQNPELKGKIPPVKWMYMFNLWLPEHPVAKLVERYVSEEEWSKHIFPDWFHFYEIYAVEKLKPHNTPIKWLADFLDARFDNNLIKSLFYREDISFKQNVLDYLNLLEEMPFELKETADVFKNVNDKKVSKFEEIQYDKFDMADIYDKNSVFGHIIESLRKNTILGKIVRINENGEKIDSLFIRTSKWFNPTIEDKPSIFSNLINGVKSGIVKCDSMILARHLGFFRVEGIFANKAYSIEQHVQLIKWKKWINEHPEHVPVDSAISLDIDLSRRILFSPVVKFVKIKPNGDYYDKRYLILPQITMKTTIKEMESNRLERTIEVLENVKREFIDVLPWEDDDGIVKCKVIGDKNYSFMGSIQSYYQKIYDETERKIFDIIIVIPSTQGNNIEKDGYGIAIRQHLFENSINNGIILIAEENEELWFGLNNIPVKKDGSGIRDESGIFEKIMDTINSAEIGVWFWRQEMHYEIKDM